MTVLLIAGSAVVGAGVGFVGGAWYGLATDTSDMPMLAAFTAPLGALAGGFVGVIAGSAVFT